MHRAFSCGTASSAQKTRLFCSWPPVRPLHFRIPTQIRRRRNPCRWWSIVPVLPQFHLLWLFSGRSAAASYVVRLCWYRAGRRQSARRNASTSSHGFWGRGESVVWLLQPSLLRWHQWSKQLMMTLVQDKSLLWFTIPWSSLLPFQTPRRNALLWACFLPESILCFFFLRALKSLKFAGSLCQGIETLQNGFSPNWKSYDFIRRSGGIFAGVDKPRTNRPLSFHRSGYGGSFEHVVLSLLPLPFVELLSVCPSATIFQWCT